MSDPNPDSSLTPPTNPPLQKRTLTSTTKSPSKAATAAERTTSDNGDQSEPKRKKRKKSGHRKDIARFARRHCCFKIAYIGTKYHGYARQIGFPNTVEETLLNAFRKAFLIGEDDGDSNINYAKCGRTDIGVSALGNAVTIDVRSNLRSASHVGMIPDSIPEGGSEEKKTEKEPAELDYVKMLNGCLPPDIRVLGWCPVPPGFSARFNCRRRVYKYYFFRDGMDLDAMRQAASYLVGSHDFRNFCKRDVVNVTTFVREVQSIDISPCSLATPSSSSSTSAPSNSSPQSLADSLTTNSEFYEIQIVGNAFLWHQIRFTVAALFLVGRRLESPEIIKHMLDIDKCPGQPHFKMASEVPLVLFDCDFPDLNFEISEENKTRVLRDLFCQWRQRAMEVHVVESFWRHLATSFDFGDSSVEDRIRGPQLDQPARKKKKHAKLLERKNRGPSLEQQIAALHGKRLEQLNEQRRHKRARESAAAERNAGDDRSAAPSEMDLD